MSTQVASSLSEFRGTKYYLFLPVEESELKLDPPHARVDVNCKAVG